MPYSTKKPEGKNLAWTRPRSSSLRTEEGPKEAVEAEVEEEQEAKAEVEPEEDHRILADLVTDMSSSTAIIMASKVT